MLDTEHIEIRIRLKEPFGAFLKAIRRRADAIVFNSMRDRQNVTVYYSDDEAHKIPVDTFPSGCSFTGIVKKCRVVHRGHNEFAIIPICLPQCPDGLTEWKNNPAALRVFNQTDTDSLTFSEKRLFYNVALLASLLPLRWIVRSLYAFGWEPTSAFSISLPTHRDTGVARGLGYSLKHLEVMYPGINHHALVEEIARVVKEAESEGMARRDIKGAHLAVTKEDDPKATGRKGSVAASPPHFDDQQLKEDALLLMQVIKSTVDFREAGRKLVDENANSDQGLTAEEIFDLGKRLGFAAAHISTLFDILIDDATLVTRVQRVNTRRGFRWMRTFLPDGEIVSDVLAKCNRQWGLPHGF